MTEPPRRHLSIYLLREEVAGQALTTFDQAIQRDVLNRADLSRYDLERDDFQARLYVQDPVAGPPNWISFLREEFSDLEAPLSQNIRAVLVLRFRYYRKDRYFALAFGHGRFMLEEAAYVRDFGLRTALNIIYEGDDPDALAAPSRVRRIDAKTVDVQTFRMRRQASHYSTFESFGVDIRRDLLSAVTGEPASSLWGSRVSGTDALYLDVPVRPAELGRLCREVWRIARSDDYKTRFSWIDNVQTVTDPALVAQLQSRLLDLLRNNNLDGLELAPPEIIDWDTVADFGYSTASDRHFPDLRLRDYISVLQDAGKLDDLEWRHLKQSHKVLALSGPEEIRHRWSALACIDGELHLDAKLYLVSEGDFFCVDRAYLDELDAFIEAIDESDVNLPGSTISPDGSEQREDDYNAVATDSSDAFILLDKRTVRIKTHTSPIEVCDILTAQRQFIHVKRKLAASSLSHLFSQGSVSADLFLMSDEYRKRVAEEVAAVGTALAATGNPADVTRFLEMLRDAAPTSYEVVYAVIAKWRDRTVAEALPFFSKINLRMHAENLHRMGYTVTFKRIPLISE